MLRSRLSGLWGWWFSVALRPHNILSLCAGVGGLELGISLALGLRGGSTRGICYVEREAAAAASLVASMEAGWLHPAPVWSDLLTFDARPWRGLVHILASGDPCQDNSVAGKREGEDGERFLAPEVVRVAKECRPDLIFRENVPGNADGQLAAIVPALEALGYRVAAGIFSSAETGNTMRRERLFIMAVRKDLARGMGARSSRECLSDLGGGCGDVAWPEHGVEQLTEGRSAASREAEGRRASSEPSGCGVSLGSPECGSDGRLADDAGRGSIGRAAVDGAGDCFERPAELDDTLSDRCGTRRSDNACDDRNITDATGWQLARPDGIGRWAEGNQGIAPDNALQLRGRMGTILPPAVIPGPTDSRWIDVLDRFPELQPALSKEEAESHVRRGFDAVAHRVERLRATGNGVDPLAAAYAFLSLDALLSSQASAG